MNHQNILAFRKGITNGIPIALGYLAVSFTLGIEAKKTGLTALNATVMSLTNLTSAGEFAALDIIRTGAPYMVMAFSQGVINLRYLLMSCALSQKLDSSFPPFHRFIVGFGVTDEIFGISAGIPGKLNPFYSYGAMSGAVPGWALGTCLGVIMGNVLPVRIVSSLSIALYGMFLAVIIPPTKTSRVLAGVVISSMVLSWLFEIIPALGFISSGMKIILLTLLIAGAAAILFPVKEESNHEE